MEKAMRLPLTVIAGLVMIGSAAVAQPPKDASKSVSPKQQPAQIVLASADPIRSPTTDATKVAVEPAKRRITPRVTTCRCGDLPVEPESRER